MIDDGIQGVGRTWPSWGSLTTGWPGPPWWTRIALVAQPALSIYWFSNIYKMSHGITRVSTGIPGYGLRTEMIRKFFPFPLWKRFRKTGIPERFPERFFPVKRKFPEHCSGITDRYGIPDVPEIFRKLPVSGTFGTRITLKSYIC